MLHLLSDPPPTYIAHFRHPNQKLCNSAIVVISNPLLLQSFLLHFCLSGPSIMLCISPPLAIWHISICVGCKIDTCATCILHSAICILLTFLCNMVLESISFLFRKNIHIAFLYSYCNMQYAYGDKNVTCILRRNFSQRPSPNGHFGSNTPTSNNTNTKEIDLL